MPTNPITPRPADAEPRLLNRSQAAAYCGYSPGQFSRLVSAGVLSPPVLALRRRDKKALDLWLDRLSGITPDEPEDPFDKWEREYEAEKALRRQRERHDVDRAERLAKRTARKAAQR